jgi:hypothetical protein
MDKYIYLSGPISGQDYEERFKAFEEKEAMFERNGDKVFNPMKNGLPPESSTHQHMRRDLSVLTNEETPITHIFMMNKWTHSAGCWKEFETAVSCGITVLFEEMNLSENDIKKYGGVKFE